MSILYLIAAAVAPLAPAASLDQAIVIQGARDRRKPADNFLRQMVPPSMDEQFSRFEEPLCPGAIGLPEQLRKEVIERIRLVAKAAAIPAGSANCTPNLLIIVVDDKKALIEGMQRKKDAYLYGVGADRQRRLIGGPGPVAAWQISDVVDSEGRPLRVDGDGYPRLFTTRPASRIRNNTRSRIIGAIIVVEQRGLVNVTTRQMADFALVRGLAPIQPRDAEAPDTSVLSLFNADARAEDAPQSLTWWDLALLKALADTRSDLLASIQRTEIRDKIIREMAKAPADVR